MANHQSNVSVSLLDRAIAAFSPKRGLERLVYKDAFARQASNISSRAYDIGRRGRSTDGWRTTGASATSEIGSVISLSRQRARDLVRNNTYAASAISKLAAKTVGTGILPRLEGIKKAARTQIMSDWNRFSDTCDPEGQIDFPGIQNLAFRSIVESGEVLIKYEPRPSNFGLKIPLQMRVLEPDYLDHTKNMPLDNGGAIIYGVEYDGFGRRVAYWMFDHHPGDVLMYRGSSLQSKRIEAQYVDHVFEVLRPGQVRGITWFAPAALKLRDIGDYEEAEGVRKKVEACTVGFIKNNGTPASLTQQGLSQDASGKNIEQMAPGMFIHGRPGEDIEFNNPTSTPGVTEHLIQQLHAAAAGIRIPYFMMTGDVSQTNYSSMRGAMLDFWDYLDQWQHIMMVPGMCRKTWARFDQYRRAAIGKEVDESARVIWTPPVRPLIDPLKDAEAEKKLIRIGRKTQRQSIAETGEDPDDVIEEIAQTNKQLDQKGIILDSDPRHVMDSGKSQDATQKQGDESNANAKQE